MRQIDIQKLKKPFLVLIGVVLLAAVLTLSLVFGLTSDKGTTNPVLEPQAGLPLAAGTVVNGVNYAAGDTIFRDRAIEAGSVESDYVGTGTDLTSGNFSNYFMATDTSEIATDLVMASDIEVTSTGTLFNQRYLASGRTIDGAGHTITINLNRAYTQTLANAIGDYSANVYAAGILVRENKGTIKNLKIIIKSGTTITVNAASDKAAAIGLICGWNSGTIENVCVEIESGASVTVSGSGARDVAFGGISGISGNSNQSYGNIDNAKTVLDGGMTAVSGGACHIALGGIVGRLETGAYNHLQIAGSGSFTVSGSASGWRFVGGIAGMARTGGGFEIKVASGTTSFGTAIATYTGTFTYNAAGENYVGLVFGSAGDRSFAYNLYTQFATALSTATHNVVAGATDTSNASFYVSGLVGGTTPTQKLVTSVETTLAFVYSATSGAVVTDTDWDGVVGYYSGLKNGTVSITTSHVSALLDTNFGYVRILSNATTAVAWTWSVASDAAVWPTDGTVDEGGDVPIGYLADDNVVGISNEAEFKAVFVTGNTAALVGEYYLENDITLTNYTGSDEEFFGIFDGAGYTITVASNSTWALANTQNIGSDFYVIGGIVGTNSGTIKNLKVKYATNTFASTNQIAMGGIAGYNLGTIKNCGVTIEAGSTFSLNGIAGNAALLGGIVGWNASGGTILACSTVLNGTMTYSGAAGGNSAAKAMGGIAGGADNSVINMCSFRGTGNFTPGTYNYCWSGGAVGIARASGSSGAAPNQIKGSGAVSIDYFAYGFVGTTNINTGSIGACNGIIMGCAQGQTLTTRVYTTSAQTAYTYGATTTSVKNIVVSARDIDIAFVYNNTADFVGIRAIYIGTGSYAADGFSHTLGDVFIYNSVRNDYILLLATEAGTYSWSWAESLSTEQDLRDLLASTTTLANRALVLTRDISLVGTLSSPIVVNGKTIETTGVINGNNKTITLSGYVTLNSGVIAANNSGVIRDLTINITADVTLSTASTLYLGLVANSNTGTISNVNVTGGGLINATSTSGDVYLGGIAATNTGTITSSTVSLSVSDKLRGTANGSAYVGGIVGSNAGTVSRSTTVIGSGGGIKASAPSTGTTYLGGIAGNNTAGSLYGNTVINNGVGSGGIIVIGDSTVYIGGHVGNLTGGTLDLATISGGGRIGRIEGTAQSRAGSMGSVAGRVAGALGNFSIIYAYGGTFNNAQTGDFVTVQGLVIGTDAATSGTMFMYYYGTANLTSLRGSGSALTVRHRRVYDVEDVKISADFDSSRVIASYISPVYGIADASNATFDEIKGVVVLSSAAASNLTITWNWVTSFSGITGVGGTEVYGDGYAAVEVPNYADGNLSDYGRIIAGYGISGYSFEISDAATLLEWLSITKTVDETYTYASKEYLKEEYEYAYLSADITITDSVFFNAQGVLAAGRVLDGSGHSITSSKVSDWGAAGSITPEILNYTDDAALIASLGLTGLGSANKNITITSGLLAINYGTIRNVEYKVAAMQKVNDSSISGVGNNWIHGYICGINAGVIENVGVTITQEAMFHTDSVATTTGFAFLMGGVVGYNAGGRVSYASTKVNGTFNMSSRGGVASFGGVVGMTNGGKLDHLKFSGTGTISMTALNNTATGVNLASPYFFGGILGVGHSRTGSSATATLSAFGGIVINSVGFSYMYNGFRGSYTASTNTATKLAQGVIAGRITGDAAYNATTNPRLMGMLFDGTAANYAWAQETTAFGTNNYTNISRGSNLAIFGGFAAVNGNVFAGGGINAVADGGYNAYFDYWTRSNASTNGFVVDFEKLAAIDTVGVYNNGSAATSNTAFLSESNSSAAMAPFISWNSAVDNAVYVADGYLTGCYGTNNYALYLKVNYISNLPSKYFAIGTLEKSGQARVTTGTQITSSTKLPLKGSGSYYLAGDVTINFSGAYEATTETFSGQLYGNGYTLTITSSGYSSSNPATYSTTTNAGILTNQMNYAAVIRDLTINNQSAVKFAKSSGDDWFKKAGLIAGDASGTITNCVINHSGYLEVQNGTFWTGADGDTVGLLAGYAYSLSVSDVVINHTGQIVADANGVGSGTFGQIYRPQMYASAGIGATAPYSSGDNNRNSLSNIYLSGSGSIISRYGSTNRAMALIGNNYNGTYTTINNVFLWDCNYTMTATAPGNDNVGPHSANKLYDGNSATIAGGKYAVNGQDSSSYIGTGVTWSTRYYTEGSRNAYIGSSAYQHSVDTVTISVGTNNSPATNANLYMDAALYLNSSLQLVERYTMRNAIRGMILWKTPTSETYYTNGSTTFADQTITSERTYYNSFSLGMKTTLKLVDAKGNVVTPAQVASSRAYDGTDNVTAVYSDIADAIADGLITQTAVDAMEEWEITSFLLKKYQYSYQLYDFTGTAILNYKQWSFGTSAPQLNSALYTQSEFVGTYSIALPETKTIDSRNYYYFNADNFLYATNYANGSTAVNYEIQIAKLLASPDFATAWAEESAVNFYIPRAEDGAVTQLSFFSTIAGNTKLLADEIYNDYAYTTATTNTTGGITYAFVSEKVRGGTNYYVAAYKLNGAVYELVATRAAVFTMIDSSAPVVGVLDGASIRTNLINSDIVYTDSNGDGILDYGTITLYVKDVSAQPEDYTLISSPIASIDHTTVNVTEYDEGLIYTISCYGSAQFTFSAADKLARETTKTFTIDIVKPQLIVNYQLTRYNNPASAYHDRNFINSPTHQIHISSISDNLTATSVLRSGLKWSVTDADSGLVVLSSDLNGQHFERDVITLPLSGVYIANAVLRVWVEDNVGNVTEVIAGDDYPIIIDARPYTVYYGESLITKEGTFAANPTFFVTYATTNETAFVNYNNNGYITLSRFDSLYVSNWATRSGFNYIGYGINVNYPGVDGERELDYTEESLEIQPALSQVLSLDGGTYSGVAMTDKVKVVMFYTVALSIGLSTNSVVNTDTTNTQGLLIANLVSSVTKTIQGVTGTSSVVTSANFLNFINLVIYDENDNVYYDSTAATNAHNNIPLNTEGAYSITFTINASGDFDKYYTVNSASSIFSISVINPANPRATVTLARNTINLMYNDTSDTSAYAGSWAESAPNFGWTVKDVFRAAYTEGDMTIAMSSGNIPSNLFDNLKFTVIYNGSVYSSEYITESGTYTVSVQNKAGKGFTLSYNFSIVISKATANFQPYAQETTYGNGIATDAYYTDWESIAWRDKEAFVWSGLRYETVDGVHYVYYIDATTSAKVTIGTLSTPSSSGIVSVLPASFDAQYTIASINTASKTLSINFFRFRSGVVSTAPTAVTTQRNAGNYSGSGGIILNNGAAPNYTYSINRYAPSLVINRRSITVRIKDEIKYYNGEDPAIYEWELSSGSFGYTDGTASFATSITRTRPSDGIDQVGQSYVLSGTIFNSNYDVVVNNGTLSIEALHLNYYVSGLENMKYDGLTDYFGTLTVRITNAKQADAVTAEIYYFVGYTGANAPIYVAIGAGGIYKTYDPTQSGLVNSYTGQFQGKKTQEAGESIALHNIDWVNPGQYQYKIVASSSTPGFATNYTNTEVTATATISSLTLYIVASDQIIPFGSNVNTTNSKGMTYTLEGVADGDTVTLSALTISLLQPYNTYNAGKYVGVIQTRLATVVSTLGLSYNVVYVFGNLTVEKAKVTVNWAAVNKLTYNGSNLASGFTTGITAGVSSLTDSLTFTYYNAQGLKVSNIINAGGYRIQAKLAEGVGDNYVIDPSSEYFVVNVDKAILGLQAFGNSYWNATDDSRVNVSNDYRRFTTAISLATVLSENISYLQLVNAAGAALSSSLAAPYSSWRFVVSSSSGTSISHTVYGNGETNVSLPTANITNGTFEVIVTVPESINYYGVTQRVIFVINTDNGNANGSNVTRSAGSHYTVSAATTQLSGLGSSVGYYLGPGTNASTSYVALEGTRIGTWGHSNFGWAYFYVNVELSDEYFMLAQQGLLTLSLTGTANSTRYAGVAWNYNNADATAVVVRGIGDARDYYYGTSNLGETGLSNWSGWDRGAIYSSGINTWGEKYANSIVGEASKTAYTRSFTVQWSPRQSSYRLYFIGYMHNEDYSSNDNKGWLEFYFSNLRIRANVSSVAAPSYTMETVDKSVAANSLQNLYIPNTATTLYNKTANPPWVIVSGTKYYYNKDSFAVYTDSARTNRLLGWEVRELTNYVLVKHLATYSANARTWRFTVGDTNAGTLGINPQTFSIKVRLKTGGTGIWSVANGKINVTDITNLYNRIVFETALLGDDIASLEELSVYNYNGTQASLSARAYLDNVAPTIGNIRVSTAPSGTYTAFDVKRWYNTAQYIRFDVAEDTAVGFSGIATAGIRMFYYNGTTQVTVPVSIGTATTESGKITLITCTTTAVLDGTRLYYIEARDIQGNLVVSKIDFHYDTTDENNLTLTVDDTVTSAEWYDDVVTVTNTVGLDFANEIGISIGKMSFLVTPADVWTSQAYKTATYNSAWRSMTLNYSEELGYYSTMSLTTSGEYYCIYRFVTGAGNIVYANLGLVKIDKVTPEIDVTAANPADDSLVISGEWESGSVTFYVTGTKGISGGLLEYSNAGASSTRWYSEGSASQPASMTVTAINDRLYTAVITVSTTAFVESNYALRFTAGNGSVISAVFANGTNQFALRIDNVLPIITTDVIAWQSKAQDALINITENESGVGVVAVEEYDKDTGNVIAFFTESSSFVGKYADYVEGVTAEYVDDIYDIIEISSPSTMSVLLAEAYVDRIFKYTGVSTGSYVSGAYYKVVTGYSFALITVNSISTSAGMEGLKSSSNVNNIYYYTGVSSGDLTQNNLYRLTYTDGVYRFVNVTVGSTRRVTNQGGNYYFKFDDADYKIIVKDAVGNAATANYTPQVDSYTPTINVVALKYDDFANVNFTYAETMDLSSSTPASILSAYASSLIPIYLTGATSAAYSVLTTKEGNNYFAYLLTPSNLLKLALPTASVEGKLAFSISSVTYSEMLSVFGITSIAFYPAEGRVQVRNTDGNVGDGVNPMFCYTYSPTDTAWTTDKVRFIVTNWTAGASGGTLYYSAGVVNTISQWNILRTISSFSSSLIYQDFTNLGISLEVTADGANDFTFFYRSTSNKMVHYNFRTHQSEVRDSVSTESNYYTFRVKIDTTNPAIQDVGYLSGSSYNGNISSKTDWWTTAGGMKVRFFVTDRVTGIVTSEIDSSSIRVEDSEGNSIAVLPENDYYYFIATYTSEYTISVSDNVGNSVLWTVRQAGDQPLLIDLVPPVLTVVPTSNGVAYSGGWATEYVELAITGEFGDSLATLYIETYDEEVGEWTLITVLTDDTPSFDSLTNTTTAQYSYVLDDEILTAMRLRVRLVTGAGAEKSYTLNNILIDTETPVVNYTAYLTGTTTEVPLAGTEEWTTNAVDIAFSVSDMGSGVMTGSVKYKRAGDADFTPLALTGGRYYITGISDTTVYVVQVEDNAGNVYEHSYSWNIDAVNPVIDSYSATSDGTAYSGANWTANPVIVTFRVGFAISDATRTGDIQYREIGGEWSALECTKTADGNAGGIYYYIFTHTFTNVEKTYQFRAISKAGNISAESHTQTIKVDAIAPYVEAVYSIDGRAWDYENYPWATSDITVDLTTAVGISGATIEVYKNDTKIHTITCTYGVSEYQYIINKEYADANYRFRAVKSGAGLNSYADSEVQAVKFDDIEPDISVTSSYVKGSWTNQNVALNITLTMGASYQKTKFFMSEMGASDVLLWETLNSTSVNAATKHANVSNWSVFTQTNSSGATIATITFVYTVTADTAVNPIVQTKFAFRMSGGNGLSDRDTSYSDENSIRIDKFAPIVTVVKVEKTDTSVEYKASSGVWAWTDGKLWSNKHIKYTFSVTYFESGATLRYSEGGGTFINTSVIKTGSVQNTAISVGSNFYTAYTVTYTLTLTSDKSTEIVFKAESGAGTDSVGYKYYNDDVLSDIAVGNYSMEIRLDMTTPIVYNEVYLRDDGLGNYTSEYNPQSTGYVSDAQVKVAFKAEDVANNGVSSGVYNVKVTKNGIDTVLTGSGSDYFFFVTDSYEYTVTVTDNSGRAYSKIIQIGVDSVIPTLEVSVTGGEDGVSGYSTDESITDFGWLTTALQFGFMRAGTVFGSSSGVIKYSFDGISWTNVGLKSAVLSLSSKITYGDRIMFKAVSGAGLESDVATILLKLDLREYSLTFSEHVGSYQGDYADVIADKSAPYKRGDTVTVSISPFADYIYNYRTENDVRNDNFIGGSYTITFVGEDIVVRHYFKETVRGIYENLTQYLKYRGNALGNLSVPVRVLDSLNNNLGIVVTYALSGGTSTNNIALLGKHADYPLGDYTITVQLNDTTNYLLEAPDETKVLRVRYFEQAGTETAPYLIDHEADLAYINAEIYNVSTAHFALNNDIVFTVQHSVPGEFRAVLDGRNFSFRLGEMLQLAGLTATPLFEELSGTVKNLGIRLNSTVINVQAGDYASEDLIYGFLAGRLSSGRLTDSFIVADLRFVSEGTRTGNLYIGGLVGLVDLNSSLNNVFSDAWLDVRGLTEGSLYVGGAAAIIEADTVITNSFSTASVKGGANLTAAGMLAPTHATASNKVVDDNIYIDGVWTGVLGNVTYYQLYNTGSGNYGNYQVTKSPLTGVGTIVYVKDLVSSRFAEYFDEYQYINGNIRFEVANFEQFEAIEDFLWADFIQTADLTIDNASLSRGTDFRGVYDGNGRAIYLTVDTTTDYALFDTVSGTIKNLYLADVEFSAELTESAVVAVLVNRLVGGKVDGIVIGGDFDVHSTGESLIAGGLVGIATEGAAITDVVSTIYVSIDGVTTEIGAIVGSAQDTFIDNVFAVSTVNVNYLTRASIGSVAGSVTGQNNKEYLYRGTGLYDYTTVGDVQMSGSTVANIVIGANAPVSSALFTENGGIITYNGEQYAYDTTTLALYKLSYAGIVNYIDSNTVHSFTVGARTYNSGFTAQNGYVSLSGKAYAFSGNTYANGIAREKTVGYAGALNPVIFGYTTLTALMDNTVGYAIMDDSDVYTREQINVRDALLAMFAVEFDEGSGTEVNPFILSSTADFAKISRYMYAHYKIVLPSGETGLTFADGEWRTIGVGMNFTGSITADSVLDAYGHPALITLRGITDTFIDRNYGRLSSFVLSVTIDKLQRADTVFGVVTNYNYGIIDNVDVSGTATVQVTGAYTLKAGGMAGVSVGGQISESNLNVTLRFKAQTLNAGIAVGYAENTSLSGLTLEASLVGASSGGDSRVGSYIGKDKGDSSDILRYAGYSDVANATIKHNGVNIDATAVLKG